MTKEGIGTKGPTLSTYISIPGRYLVLMPFSPQSGVSRKIEDEDTRKKMREASEMLDAGDEAVALEASSHGSHYRRERCELLPRRGGILHRRVVGRLRVEEVAEAVPKEIYRELGELGYFGMLLPEKYGGLGRSSLDALIVLEEFARISSAVAFPVFESCVGPVRAIERFAGDGIMVFFNDPVEIENPALQAVRVQFRYQSTNASCASGAYNDRDDLVFAVSSAPDTTPPTTSAT